MGLIPTKRSLELCEKVCASSFCRLAHIYVEDSLVLFMFALPLNANSGRSTIQQQYWVLGSNSSYWCTDMVVLLTSLHWLFTFAVMSYKLLPYTYIQFPRSFLFILHLPCIVLKSMKTTCRWLPHELLYHNKHCISSELVSVCQLSQLLFFQCFDTIFGRVTRGASGL